jgi:quinol monooxygenase YgiN
VTVPTIALETTWLTCHKRFDTPDGVGFFGMARSIRSQKAHHTGCMHMFMMTASAIPSTKEFNMLAVIAKLKVAPGKDAEFEKVMLALAKEVRANEAGNKLYTLTKTDAGDYLMLELYDSEEALTLHGQTAHFKAAGPKFAGLMAGRPEIQRLKVIG